MNTENETEDMNFCQRVKNKLSELEQFKDKTGGKWHGTGYSHILSEGNEYLNFIDGENLDWKKPDKCDVKGALMGENETIKYHFGAAHLNSSQVMCINFFNKFFEKTEWEQILIKALVKSGVKIPEGSSIKEAAFEYVPDKGEKTNFDFYFTLENGKSVSVEVKYTESEFGKTSNDKNYPDRYEDKWNNIYKDKVKISKALNRYGQEEFYKNYQINRNIVLAEEDGIVLFLTPRANQQKQLKLGREYIDGLNKTHPEIMNIYWEDLVANVMESVSDELKCYYRKFKEKYIDILEEEKNNFC